MSTIREIKVISSTKNTVKVLQSAAETWGQLKDSISDYGDLGKMTAVIKETRATLERDDAVLPNTAFSLYLSPKQIKAGNGKQVEIITALRDKLSAAFDELIEEIEDGDYDDDDDEVQSSSRVETKSAEDEEFLKSLKSL